jgi:hypothetical protein
MLADLLDLLSRSAIRVRIAPIALQLGLTGPRIQCRPAAARTECIDSDPGRQVVKLGLTCSPHVCAPAGRRYEDKLRAIKAVSTAPGVTELSRLGRR